MPQAAPKTQITSANPKAFVEALTHPTRRRDGLQLLDLFETVTGLEPKMWGPSIIGYGRYHFRYDSGREGDWFLTGFSPRSAQLVIYIMPGYGDLSEALNRLGKHRVGKSCLYINKLADIDVDVLAEMVEASLAIMKTKYETYDR